ncbi:MAG TPA: 4,5-DOPA dioxygenase extradiol [Bacteroidales bacterium]|jgi:4,5-DOPA dioxygenase extradiol|nr:4,5-DOPA dioxygenase extradiol [Bacteroidales bacterium]HNX84662.1 4,5-DOPA dioxygenase extradiol [Bacteroidales bacterium]HNY56803.1 4,5-DOPA dioxygenase extradiol [Bacteroidales bacterium]HOC48590.1 4,5-DOPA dioxygenase extradiol [Bacteroidales bacterium]HOH14389.1 4,5-DOPA dioxygenase extradiol [Bacteroidales bacterium]
MARLLSRMHDEGLSFAGDGYHSEKMPVLFVGHGSPMNAIEENEFAAGWREMGSKLPRPAAILCVSAHWQSKGTKVTAMEKPETIHDFGGFPRELYEVQYPAPGSPELARTTATTVHDRVIELDKTWGLDHGAWSVIRRMYPAADIPVVELSLNYHLTPQQHYDLAREIAPLRRKGVLIIGSGNMVHNLGLVAWDHVNTPGYAYDWAIEADAAIKKSILGGDHAPLINYQAQGRAFRLAIPTPEHFIPLLYSLALQEKDEPVELFNDKPVGGSLTMTSVKIG